MFNLNGKVAVITGASRGLGFDTAKKYCELGAKVVIGDILEDIGLKAVNELRAKGYDVEFVKTDVTNFEDITKLLNTAVTKFGKLDILVNGAGVIATKPLVKMTSADIDRVIDINLKGTMYTSQVAVGIFLQQQNGGKIINFASQAGRRGFGLLCSYSASKFGVVGFTEALANEVGPYNITVNAICPGIIRTEMWEKIIKEGGEAIGVDGEKALWEESIKDIPLGRPQTGEDIANAAAFLASDAASEITGQALSINGGQVCN